MTPYQRIFGSGPWLLLLAFGLLVAAVKLQSLVQWPQLPLSRPVRLGFAGIVLALGGAIIVWAFQTLPLGRRGRQLVTEGPYRYVRHPLYTAVFLSAGFAAFLVAQTYLALVAMVCMFVAGHWFIGYEEALMEQQFQQAWRDYARQTPRFFPRVY